MLSLPHLERLALDTAPLIYYIEKDANYFDSMKKIMRYISGSPHITAYASVMALKEVLVKPLTSGDSELAEEYENILTDNEQLVLMDVTPAVARKAAELRAKYGKSLKALDAVHVATAIVSACDVFLTNDLALKKIDEIRVICLSEFPIIITEEDKYT
jgi:predicted nucleic acid-binding protein